MSKKLIGVSGFKNSGKTTLTAKLITEFSRRGFIVSSVKHAHHEFDLDQQGTDTDKHRGAGAREVVIASAKRWAIMHEITDDEAEPNLTSLIEHMAACDMIVAEGYKSEPHPKVLVVGNQEQAKLIDQINNIVLIAADPNVEITSDKPRFARDDVEAMADYIDGLPGLSDAR